MPIPDAAHVAQAAAGLVCTETPVALLNTLSWWASFWLCTPTPGRYALATEYQRAMTVVLITVVTISAGPLNLASSCSVPALMPPSRFGFLTGFFVPISVPR